MIQLSKNYLIYYIVGLPGSGKTTFMCNNFSTETHYLIDDINTPDRLPEILDKPIVITDPYAVYFSNYKMSIDFLCKRYNIKETDIITINFDNKPNICLENVKNRNIKRVNSFIRKATEFYNPLNYSNNIIIPVFGQE